MVLPICVGKLEAALKRQARSQALSQREGPRSFVSNPLVGWNQRAGVTTILSWPGFNHAPHHEKLLFAVMW